MVHSTKNERDAKFTDKIVYIGGENIKCKEHCHFQIHHKLNKWITLD